MTRGLRLLVFALLPAMALAAAPRPNILLILTDQQHAGMLSCAGNSYVKTPSLDSLARTGTRFERAYCGNPVCVPSRFCMMSGALPSAIGMETNNDTTNAVPRAILNSAMGAVFRRAGYETVYSGKTHLPGLRNGRDMEPYGFKTITVDPRDELVTGCVKFLRAKHDKPFLLVASFINPHDICYMAIRSWRDSLPAGTYPDNAPRLDPPAIRCLDTALQRPAGVPEEEFFRTLCPPLPGNAGLCAGELSVFGESLTNFRGYVRKNWTDRDWRLHRWAYARLTESVDGQIGSVLAALRAAGLDKDTLVVFTSDHGDMDGAHGFEHKSLLYEEAIHVPMIVSWPGVTSAGAVDRTHLVSTGLDLIPTLCDFAGVTVPAGLQGRSVRPLAEGRPADGWRDYLVVENHRSRLVHAGSWKYMVGAAGDTREMITDLAIDPGEMRNLAGEPAARERLALGRRMLKEYYASRGLNLAPRYVVDAETKKRDVQ